VSSRNPTKSLFLSMASKRRAAFLILVSREIDAHRLLSVKAGAWPRRALTSLQIDALTRQVARERAAPKETQNTRLSCALEKIKRIRIP
jgi:hypothetical protein